MKKLILLMVTALISSLAFSQKLQSKDVPVAVKQSFKKHYPTIDVVKWEKEDGNYEAGFINTNKHESSALFDAKGAMVESEEEIKVSQLPASVAKYVASHYSGKKIKEASKIISADGIVTYEAEIEDVDLIFNATGGFLKEVKEDIESEKEKD